MTEFPKVAPKLVEESPKFLQLLNFKELRDMTTDEFETAKEKLCSISRVFIRNFILKKKKGKSLKDDLQYQEAVEQFVAKIEQIFKHKLTREPGKSEIQKGIHFLAITLSERVYHLTHFKIILYH